MARRHARAKRLQVILEMAEREEEKLLGVWGKLQQQLQAEREQRTQLESFRLDYQRSISTPSHQAFSATQLHTTLGFISQITNALNSQQERLVLLEKQTEVARQAYLVQQGKTQALIKLMDKLDAEYDLEQDRQLQKQLDEWANRAASDRMRQR